MSKNSFFKKTFLCRNCKNEFKDIGSNVCIYCKSKNLSIVKYYYKKKNNIYHKNSQKIKLCFCKLCKNEFEYNKKEGLYKCPYCLGQTLAFCTFSKLESVKETYPNTYKYELKMFRKLKLGKIKFDNSPSKRWLDFKKRLKQEQYSDWF